MLPITGTFIDEITYDIPPQNWGPEDWRLEFSTMAADGIDTLIIIRSGLRDMAVFPSESLGIRDVPDLLQFFLDEAHRHGMKMYIGSYDSGTLGFEWNTWKEELAIARRFLPEIMNRYGDHPAFHGWYMANETVLPSENAASLYAGVTDLMKELADKPLLISPGWPSYVYKDDTPADRHRKFVDGWEEIFRRSPAIDICAFQDGSCCYGNDFDQVFELVEYMEETLALCRSHKVELWQNIETFSWKFPIKFPTIDWRYLKRKMEIASKYSEKLITFEYSHFLSPNSMYPASRNLNRRYREQILGGRPFR